MKRRDLLAFATGAVLQGSIWRLAKATLIGEPSRSLLSKISNGNLIFNAPLLANLNLTAGSGSFSLTRSTAGSFIASGGNITQASSGAGRFTFDPRGSISAGIFIGSAVTNAIKQSQVWGTTWSNSGATITANSTVAPDGTTTGDTITTSGGTNTNVGFTQFVTVSTAAAYSFSSFFFGSAIGGVEFAELFNNVSSYNSYPSVVGSTHLPYWYPGASGVSLNAYVTEYSQGFQRLSVKLITPGSVTSDQRVSLMNMMAQTGTFPGDFPTGANIVMWGAMMSASAFTPLYFPTTTAAVTQNADVLSITTAGNCATNDFSLTLEWTPIDWSPMGTIYLWGTYVDSNNSTAVLHDGTNLIARKRIAGTNFDSIIPLSFAAWQMYRVAATFSSAGGSQIYLNGVAGTPNPNEAPCQIASTMQIGADGNGANQANSAIANISIYKNVLPTRSLGYWNNTATYIVSNIFSGSIAVPPNFLGMHIHFWPGGASTAPTYGYGTTRSIDYGPASGFGIQWRYIEPSANGVYTWTNMDQWVAAHQALGHDIIYTLYGTPTGYAEFATTADGYGYLGGASPPTSNTNAANFITALFTRYNTSGGGYSGAAPGTIKYLEVWNEPTFGSSGAALTPSSSTAWWGTNAQLASLGKAIAAAAKAVDSTVKFIGPANFLNDSNPYNTQSSFYLALIGNDGASSNLAAHLDAVSWHGYTSFIYQDNNYSQLDVGVMDYTCSILCAAAGLSSSFPRMMSEIGYATTPAAPALTNKTPTQMTTWIQRTALAYAMLGYQKCCFYSHDDVLVGEPMTSPIISTGLGFLNAMLCGKTLTSVQLLSSGQMKVVTSAGTFFI